MRIGHGHGRFSCTLATSRLAISIDLAFVGFGLLVTEPVVWAQDEISEDDTSVIDIDNDPLSDAAIERRIRQILDELEGFREIGFGEAIVEVDAWLQEHPDSPERRR